MTIDRQSPAGAELMELVPFELAESREAFLGIQNADVGVESVPSYPHRFVSLLGSSLVFLDLGEPQAAERVHPAVPFTDIVTSLLIDIGEIFGLDGINDTLWSHRTIVHDTEVLVDLGVLYVGRRPHRVTQSLALTRKIGNRIHVNFLLLLCQRWRCLEMGQG